MCGYIIIFWFWGNISWLRFEGFFLFYCVKYLLSSAYSIQTISYLTVFGICNLFSSITGVYTIDVVENFHMIIL